MEITYSTGKLERVCTERRYSEKIYGLPMADKIHQRISSIQLAENVEQLIRFRIGRCHALTQNRTGQYAMDLVHPYRLVFEQERDHLNIINILEIVDYH